MLFVLLSIGRRAWAADDERDRRLIFVLGGLFLLNLFAVQFSGDVNDNRVFWTMFGVVWLVASYGLPDREHGPVARTGRRPMTAIDDPTPLPDVDVLVSTFNEEHHLQRCLDAVLGQDYQPDRLRLLLIDGGSTDGTVELAPRRAASDAALEVVADGERRNLPEALNLAQLALVGRPGGEDRRARLS